MKKVYFVRHGESLLNVENKDQGPEGALSEKGREQAEFVAKRFQNIPVDIIVSSPYERTRETTDIINKDLHKKITHSDFFGERRSASRFFGTRHDDPEYLEVRKLAHEKWLEDPTWRHEDGESFQDVKERAQKSLELLESLEEENILVVTHAGILRAIIAVVIFGKDLTYEEHAKLHLTLVSNNTGITLIRRGTHPIFKVERWALIAWNDHAHLG
ncbi:MAG: hypothetical protein COV34_02930 [Candidatus Zambryskibacteria bacterium CG10_big_fil_rev_8_21_14_0_10_42_12]|uniref:Histidine phosphatase family protein n=1 Tax=Candidatus Zambryskibacteria bacterium CG10_big_fil_rev_8_21_14_0_10_42_12 TaxID=1975115 RepID=A0A2H0QUS8_9BACT|nr:MAG: hypothetical protein COV34_02930 [Candidatus Zambryskibacteria bacterium CG10_big_fil_rev_8_21_14_0_10_42_12]